jgi:hypothetical protein
MVSFKIFFLINDSFLTLMSSHYRRLVQSFVKVGPEDYQIRLINFQMNFIWIKQHTGDGINLFHQVLKKLFVNILKS